MSDINLSISSSSNVLTTTGANDEIYLSLSSETNVVTTVIQINNTLSIDTVGSVTPTSILNLTDVNAGSITDGQVLVYDSSTQTFIAGDITGVTDHGALTGLSDDDHLQYPPITSGTFTLDTIPARIGAIHVIPATNQVLVGKGSSTILDWISLTPNTDTSLSDTDQVLTSTRLVDLNSRSLSIYDGDNEFTSNQPVRIHSHRLRANGNDIQIGYYNALDGTATAGSIRFFPRDTTNGGLQSANLERAAGLDGTLTLANLEGTGGLMLSGAQTGGTLGLFVAHDGSIDFRAYGSGTFTGTAAKLLAVDSSGNVIEENVVSAGLGNLVEDTTPQLGGDLDAQSNNITNLGSLNGTAASTIISGGAAGATALQDVVSDTTPQLGGNLDVNGSKIVSTSNGDIDIEPNGTGDVLLGNFKFDADQTVGSGQDNHVLTYDHSSGKISLEAAAGGGGGYKLLQTYSYSDTGTTDKFFVQNAITEVSGTNAARDYRSAFPIPVAGSIGDCTMMGGSAVNGNAYRLYVWIDNTSTYYSEATGGDLAGGRYTVRWTAWKNVSDDSDASDPSFSANAYLAFQLVPTGALANPGSVSLSVLTSHT